MPTSPLSASEIEARLDAWLETEFTFHRVAPLAAALVDLPGEEQAFVLGWVRRIATTHITLAYQFGCRVPGLVRHMDRRLLESWAVHACDLYDREGLRPALQVLEEGAGFAERQRERVAGELFEDFGPVLANFLRGLSGRRLALVQGEAAYSDAEKVFLPAVLARFADREANFQLAKASVAMLWAQTRYGTLRLDFGQICAAHAEPDRALNRLHGLETLRLVARIRRELPGLHRDMERLRTELGEVLPQGWDDLAARLCDPGATAQDSVALLERACALPAFPPWCWQGELRPEAVATARAARLEREKVRLRVKLAALLDDLPATATERAVGKEPRRLEAEVRDADGRLDIELTLDGIPLAPPEDVRQLLASVYLDLAAIPPEYLVPAGDGEYDAEQYGERRVDPDAVWQGTYHEEGALFYPEWDLGRQHYRKNWCVMREKEVPPVYDDFCRRALDRHAGLVKHLRRAFEALRDDNRLEKRQAYGDEVDIDALVEALADQRAGREMSDRLFVHQHRAERDIAVGLLVDMSGSTRGWINEAEREALLLLAEALERLGDRYAIYGFSGQTRKRCELYRIKTFDEAYGAEVQARISGIRPQDYTRMGFAIRHLTGLLDGVAARTKVLVTLSDGRPDDYFDGYRGPYGIEDTRMALLEARRGGIHPFCITIDREAREYLPHMYGAARYVILDDVRLLPLKVADIYRRLTT